MFAELVENASDIDRFLTIDGFVYDVSSDRILDRLKGQCRSMMNAVESGDLAEFGRCYPLFNLNP